MEILDNATIVKNLSDSTSMGNVWSMAKGLIKAVEFTEYLWELEGKHNGYLDFTDEDSFDNWCRLWDCFEKQWKDDIECLNLDDLDRWLVDDSKDITELNFRLNKVKCRVGAMWDLDDADQLHTDLLNITVRLAEVILKLRRNAYLCMYDLEDAESFAGQRAWGMIQHVCKWVRDIIVIQKRVQKIIRGAENILNPQPDTTNGQEQTVRPTPILEDAEIKAVMQAVKGIGLMEYKDGWYYWTGDNVLLSYLCSQISQYKDFSKQMRGNNYLPDWTKFEGIFKARGRNRGEWVTVTSLKLADYKKGYMRNHDEFSPDGCKDIDEIIGRCIKI